MRWRPAEPALALRADARGDMFSGSVLHHGGAWLAWVTRHDARADPPREWLEAWRADATAQAWTRAHEVPAIDLGRSDFRDPFVTAAGSGFVMLVAEPCPWRADASGPTRSRLHLLASDDASNWRHAGAVGPWDPPRIMWEVPQLVPLRDIGAAADDDRWLLVLSRVDRRPGPAGEDRFEGSVVWHLGRFEGDQFVREGPPEGRRLDHGPDFYAACLEARRGDAEPEAPLLIAWMSNWRSARRLPLWAAAGFAGGPQTLPRHLRWDGVAPCQHPLEGLDARAGPALDPARVDDATRGRWRCTVEFDAAHPPAELRWLLCGASQAANGAGCALELVFDGTARRWTLTRHDAPGTAADAALAGRWTAPWQPPHEGRIELDMVRDACCFELFADGGRTVFSALGFGGPAAPRLASMPGSGASPGLRTSASWWSLAA